jgi:hypothetical protein
VTESVVGALLPTLCKAELKRARRKPPASFDANDCLLRSLPYLAGNTPSEIGDAIRLLTEALRLKPNYAYAHALMAIALGQIYRSAAGRQRQQAQEIATHHARRAMALDADDSLALANAGYILLLVGPGYCGRACRARDGGGAQSQFGDGSDL